MTKRAFSCTLTTLVITFVAGGAKPDTVAAIFLTSKNLLKKKIYSDLRKVKLWFVSRLTPYTACSLIQAKLCKQACVAPNTYGIRPNLRFSQKKNVLVEFFSFVGYLVGRWVCKKVFCSFHHLKLYYSHSRYFTNCANKTMALGELKPQPTQYSKV